jgi:hypothetical protein
LLASTRGVERDHGVDPAVQAIDALEVVFEELSAVDLTPTKRGAKVGRGAKRELVHEADYGACREPMPCSAVINRPDVRYSLSFLFWITLLGLIIAGTRAEMTPSVI